VPHELSPDLAERRCGVPARYGSARVWFNQTSATTVFSIRELKANPEARGVTIICTHRDAASPLFQVADRWSVEPGDLAGDEYVDWALEFCAGECVDVLVPRREIAAIARRAGEFDAAGTRVLVATTSRFDELEDKAGTYRVASALGIPVPRFEVAFDHDTYVRAYHALAGAGHRVCHKPVRGIGGRGFRLVADRDRRADELLGTSDLREITLVETEALLRGPGDVPKLIVSEYLPGPEYSVDCLAQDGDLLDAVVRVKTGGQVQHIVDEPALVGHARSLAGAFSLDSLFNVQFRDADNPRLLEVNPRAAAGLHHSDAVYQLWEAIRLTLGAERRPTPTPRPGAVWSLPAAERMRDVRAAEIPAVEPATT